MGSETAARPWGLADIRVGDIYRDDESDRWAVQASIARDFFEDCTLTIEQWLATDPDGRARASKWRMLTKICAHVAPHLPPRDDLRQEPRVGYDPIGDQPIFIFKCDNNGDTFIVSRSGIAHLDDE